MRHPKFRHIAAAGALALIVTTPLAACGDPSVSPRPAQAGAGATAAGPSTTPSAPALSPSPSAGATRQPGGHGPPKTTAGNPATKPTVAQPTSTKPTGTCLGSVRYDLDLRNSELALIKSMCFHTGGVLRIQGIGPGLVTVDPADLVSQTYEAAVVDVRFVRPGTVTVSIPQEQTHTITVVIVS